ncbi:MAG: GNAT family N-acetyltransferase [Paracoccaceae bacterium]|nr:GNAT family N-acetyltransferase [Paracoccaceae bacterium]
MYEIAAADASEGDVAALLRKHFDLMRSQSPAESCHVLPADALTASDIHMFALRETGTVYAIGALKICDTWAEVKSMHTVEQARGRGYGRAMLATLIDEAESLKLQSLKLETGSGGEHKAARQLYEQAGFVTCPPFGDYRADPLSIFMCRDLQQLDA